jgi:hypothetical protein
LKSIPTLREIFISFGAIICDDSDYIYNCWASLNGFRNLTSLEIYDFYGNHTLLIRDIVHVLRDSPCLTKLGLGFAVEMDFDDGEAVLFGAPGHETDFLERLCEVYGSTCQNAPLALETLRLGFGFYLNKSSNATNGHYLTKLLTMRSLEVLHLYNGLVRSEIDDDGTFYQEVDWTPFTKEGCASLRQLSVTRIEDDVIDWLKEGGSRVRELIVTESYSYKEHGINQFFNLPAGLSMLHTRDSFPYGWRVGSDSEWSDTDSSISDSSDSESASSQLPQMQMSRYQSLERITLDLDRPVMTVLDRLPDGGSDLTRLSISLDFETQWVSTSTA